MDYSITIELANPVVWLVVLAVCMFTFAGWGMAAAAFSWNSHTQETVKLKVANAVMYDRLKTQARVTTLPVDTRRGYTPTHLQKDVRPALKVAPPVDGPHPPKWTKAVGQKIIRTLVPREAMKPPQERAQHTMGADILASISEMKTEGFAPFDDSSDEGRIVMTSKP